MPKSGRLDDSSLEINNILRNKKLSKKEKIKKMFYIFRRDFPEDTQEESFQLCMRYYDYKMGKANPNKFYLV